MRIPDERDPADAVVWCNADDLAAAPRRFVWLLGLTATKWPRTARLDPILPGFVVPAPLLDPDPIEVADRRSHAIIVGSSEEVVLSSARLGGDKRRQTASPLQPPVKKEDILQRDRAPQHALTEADRLLARPQEAEVAGLGAHARVGWRNWNRRELTAHDGLIGAPHPMLSALLGAPQSPTSLSRLLRDPLAYVWYYALGWRDLTHKERSLTLPPDDFGRLVHELLRRAVDHLEPHPGFTVASTDEVEHALALASDAVIEEWPSHLDVPPPVLWVNTVRKAAAMGLAGLTHQTFSEASTRSWTEVPFGGARRNAEATSPLPWDPDLPVKLPGTKIQIRGSIDRLDLSVGGRGVRVTDYKTGQKPKYPVAVVLGGGAELQRVLYSLACEELLPGLERTYAQLIYLREPVSDHALRDPGAAIQRLTDWVVAAQALLEAGIAYPGARIDRRERFGVIALPAASSYVDRKSAAIQRTVGDLSAFWSSP
jgi:hypothetical protein